MDQNIDSQPPGGQTARIRVKDVVSVKLGMWAWREVILRSERKLSWGKRKLFHTLTGGLRNMDTKEKLTRCL